MTRINVATPAVARCLAGGVNGALTSRNPPGADWPGPERHGIVRHYKAGMTARTLRAGSMHDERPRSSRSPSMAGCSRTMCWA
jgi:hypothetical protein